jgi:hypothetical protein
MEEQKNIISPSGCVHADDQEPGKQPLCYRYGSYYWPYTNKPVTCNRCLNMLDQSSPMGALKRCMRSINKFNKAYIAEMDKFNMELGAKCDHYILPEYQFDTTCSHKDNDLHFCCVAGCPLGGK